MGRKAHQEPSARVEAPYSRSIPTIHRVAHDAVHAAADHLLLLLHFNHPGGVGILAEHLEDNAITQQDQTSAAITAHTGTCDQP